MSLGKGVKRHLVSDPKVLEKNSSPFSMADIASLDNSFISNLSKTLYQQGVSR